MAWKCLPRLPLLAACSLPACPPLAHSRCSPCLPVEQVSGLRDIVDAKISAVRQVGGRAAQRAAEQ